MKILALILLTLPLTACVTPQREMAATKGGINKSHFDAESLKIINLTNIEIVDKDGINTFPYAVGPMTSTSNTLLSALLEVTGADLIVSRVFMSNPQSGSLIYTFLTQEIAENTGEAKYRLNLVIKTKKGGLNLLVDYDIVAVSSRSMDVVNGPSDELERYKVNAAQTFFPF